MKTRYTLFVLGVALLLIASCNREDISITYFKQLQSTSDNTNKGRLLDDALWIYRI